MRKELVNRFHNIYMTLNTQPMNSLYDLIFIINFAQQAILAYSICKEITFAIVFHLAGDTKKFYRADVQQARSFIIKKSGRKRGVALRVSHRRHVIECDALFNGKLINQVM